MLKKIFLNFNFIFIFIFILQIILSISANELYNYNLYNYNFKQSFVINNEKYFINSYGDLVFNVNKNFIDIKINKSNYIIYKEIDNDLIKLSSNFYQNINNKIYKTAGDDNVYKSQNNMKFDSYFYPFYYVALIYNLYQKLSKIKIDKKIPKKIFFNDSILLINLVNKKEFNDISVKEIYKNSVINVADINLNIKNNEIDNIKMTLRYKDLNVNKNSTVDNRSFKNKDTLSIYNTFVFLDLKRIKVKEENNR